MLLSIHLLLLWELLLLSAVTCITHRHLLLGHHTTTHAIIHHTTLELLLHSHLVCLESIVESHSTHSCHLLLVVILTTSPSQKCILIECLLCLESLIYWFLLLLLLLILLPKISWDYSNLLSSNICIEILESF